MRFIFRWLVRILLMAVLAAIAVGVWKREEITRLLAVNSLFAPDKIVENFSHMDRAFLHRPIPRGDGPVRPLPVGDTITLPAGVPAWIETRDVTSLLALKDGQIRYEGYFRGTKAEDLRISWSMAKSYLSALFGVLLDDGVIDSIDDPVTKYAPKLIGSAYQGVSIRDVLQMASGVVFDEDYFDPNSDINRMGRVIALGGELDDFSASITDRFVDPGEQWQYVSIDTHVLGMVIRGATGRSVTDLMSEKIVAPLGQESDGYYLTDGAGVAFVLGGLNLTTRDYARFGLMIAADGRVNDSQVVPRDWISSSTSAIAPTEAGKVGYGYQWWLPVDPRPGEVFARGVYGQYLYIDRVRDVVIVVTAADRQFRDMGVSAENIDMLRRIADAL